MPVIPATEVLGNDFTQIKEEAGKIGYPLMLKASWGGGGRGMRAIRDPKDLLREVTEGKREAMAAFGRRHHAVAVLVDQRQAVDRRARGGAAAGRVCRVSWTNGQTRCRHHRRLVTRDVD